MLLLYIRKNEKDFSTLPVLPDCAKKKISDFIPGFLRYILIEKSLAKGTVEKYQGNLNRLIKELGDLRLQELTPDHFIELKEKLFNQGIKEARVWSIVATARSFLRYIEEYHQIPLAVNPGKIGFPKIPIKEVIVFTKEELKRFLEVIEKDIKKGNKYALKFRAIVAFLMNSGARISESLSVDRNDINQSKELWILAKGGRREMLFLNNDAMRWLKRYLKSRKDNHHALFVSHGDPQTRLTKEAVQRYFKKYRERAKIQKKVTPHTLRHQFCTTLLQNGANLFHVQKLARHRDIQTTIKFYAAYDNQDLKKAHSKYLNFKLPK